MVVFGWVVLRMGFIKQIRNIDGVPIGGIVKVYDVEKKELIGTFESFVAAAKFCGVSPGLVASAIKQKSRNKKNKLGKTICFR